MKIREYKKEDFDDLVRLNYELAKLEKKWFDFVPEATTLKNVKMFLKEEIDEGKTRFFVCEMDKKIVGFVSGEIKKREEFFKNRKYLCIDDLYVLPEFRKKGIGRALMQRMYMYAKEKGANDISFYVHEKNKSVLGFYKKNGFRICEYGLTKDVK